MVFGTRHTLSQLNELGVKCDGVDVEAVTKVKYPRVILDQELTFNEH